MQNNIETNKPIEGKLSPMAQIVHQELSLLLPKLRQAGLVETANELIRENVAKEDPRFIEFSKRLREITSEQYLTRKADGADIQHLAVNTNYPSKLLDNMKA